MSVNRRVFTIFLASPGDLTNERGVAKQVVSELNASLWRSGISVELLGWEDTPPAARRPQEAINRDLESADLFVGLLWRSWGQPTGDPSFSSGFDEEFRRASDLKKSFGTPEMWLFFKQVESGQLQDPGEELKKVLHFRSACEAEKKIFYKEFATAEDWERSFRRYLLTFVLSYLRESTSQPLGEGLSTVNTAIAETPLLANAGPEPSLVPVSDILADLAKGTSPTRYSDAEGGLYSLRIYLVGASLLAKSNTSSSLLGTHEINSAFRLRRRIDLLPIETDLMQRSVLADRDGLKPGWYWFPQDPVTQQNVLLAHALFDSDTEVRNQALTILRKGRVRPASLQALFSARVADHQPPGVQDAYWAYLEAIVQPSDRELLTPLLASEALRARGETLLLTAQVQIDTEAILAEAAAAVEAPSPRLTSRLCSSLGKVSSPVLTAAFSTRHSKLRNAIAAELYRRGLMHDIRAAAQADDSKIIRAFEYRDRLRIATENGDEPPDIPEKLPYGEDDQLRIERLRRLSYDQLLKKVDWVNLDGSAAYELLATIYWERMASQIRDDIADNFERIRLASVNRIVREAIEEANATTATLPVSVKTAVEARTRAAVEKQWEELDSFLRARFAAAALAGVAEHGICSNSQFVRRFLNKSSIYADVAVRAIKRIGDASDVSALVRIALDGYGDVTVAAAEAALLFSGDSSEVIHRFVGSSNPTLVKLGLAKLLARNATDANKAAKELLQNQNGDVRLEASHFLMNTLDSERLISVIDSYVTEGYYYYNVVSAVDKFLYCRIPDTESAEPEDDYESFADLFRE